MSTSYPRVHVVGSGAYYSYRPLTRFIEKVERNHFRQNSSKPKDFGQLMEAMHTTRGEGYVPRRSREPDSFGLGSRSTSLPPFINEGNFGFSDYKPMNGPFQQHHQCSSKDKIRKRFFQEDEFEDELKRDEEYLHRKELLREKKEALRNPEEDVLHRLRRKHPFRLPVEDEVVLPHESSIWPSNRKHFDLVSSYDVMVDYLGITNKNEKNK